MAVLVPQVICSQFLLTSQLHSIQTSLAVFQVDGRHGLCHLCSWQACSLYLGIDQSEQQALEEP